MRKVVAIALLIVLFQVIVLGFGKVSGASRVIWVPDDYRSIQEAVDAAESGDTVRVRAGTYIEDIEIKYKSISLVGDGANSTILKGIGDTCCSSGVIRLWSCNRTLIEGFTIAPSQKGIEIGIEMIRAKNCTITKNVITNFTKQTASYGYKGLSSGIWMEGSTHNRIFENNIINTRNGIWLPTIAGYTASPNKFNWFYSNNFIDNEVHVWGPTEFIMIMGRKYDVGVQPNYWDNGSEGNYWDDYGELDIDGDGFGDTHYVIAANNTDRYPRVVPLGSIQFVWDEMVYPVEITSNSTISRLTLNVSQKLMSFNVTGPSGTLGYCNLTISNNLVQDLWEGNFTILIDGKDPILLEWTSDLTNTYIYVTYVHSEHEVRVIPVFPSSIIVPLFMMATLLAAIVHMRRIHTEVLSSS